jgi:hypothetical protein
MQNVVFIEGYEMNIKITHVVGEGAKFLHLAAGQISPETILLATD